jgi:outer membrane protein assembly factor BamA
MSDNLSKVKLTPETRQSIGSALMNYVSSIPDGEEVEMKFQCKDEDGISHISFESKKKSKTPDLKRNMELTKNRLNVSIGGK